MQQQGRIREAHPSRWDILRRVRPCSAAWVQVCPVENLQSGGFEVVSAHITMPKEYRIAETANLFSMLNLAATSRLIVGGDFNCFPDRGAHEQLLPFSRSKWLMEVPANSALALTNNTQSCQVFPTTGTWNGFPHDFPTAPGGNWSSSGPNVPHALGFPARVFVCLCG